MLSNIDLVTRPAFVVSAVTCRSDHRHWTEPEARDDYRIVLVRSGRFRRSVGGVGVDLEPTIAYVGVPGEEERFAHPAGGDVCTSVQVAPELWRDLAGEAGGTARSALYVDGPLDLAHRRCLRAAARGDVDYAATEHLLALVHRAVEQVVARPRPIDRPATDRRLVAAAREAIAVDHPAAAGLVPLAALVGASPYRLSRAFTRELGVSVTRYRNRVRLGRALDRLEAGEPSLAVLAADLGFADQAHLSRTVREQLGHTPTVLRRLLVP